MTSTEGRLLGASDVRRLAAELDLVPTKKLGQNFVIDPGTVRRIVRTSGVTADSSVIEGQRTINCIPLMKCLSKMLTLPGRINR